MSQQFCLTVLLLIGSTLAYSEELTDSILQAQDFQLESPPTGQAVLEDKQEDTLTVGGSKCIFPFLFNGVEYNACAPRTNLPQLWCAISLYENKTMKKWDMCARSNMTASAENIALDEAKESSCEDLLPQCPEYAANGFCDNEEIKSNCLKSCDGCQNKNGDVITSADEAKEVIGGKTVLNKPKTLADINLPPCEEMSTLVLKFSCPRESNVYADIVQAACPEQCAPYVKNLITITATDKVKNLITITATDKAVFDEAVATILKKKQDLCGKVDCKNGGICEEGKCVCPPYYAGEDCSADFTNQQDLCGKADCKNGGFCEEGKCVCPPFYAGEDCSADFTNQQGNQAEFKNAITLDEGTATNNKTWSTINSLIVNTTAGLDLNNRTLDEEPRNGTLLANMTVLDEPSSIHIQESYNKNLNLNTQKEQVQDQEEQPISNTTVTTQTPDGIALDQEEDMMNYFENGDSGVNGVCLPVAMVVVALIGTLQI